MARSTVAVFEGRRKVVDSELRTLTEEMQNIERLIEQLERRRELISGRWELLMAQRDLLDERIWSARYEVPVDGLQPPVIKATTRYVPRDLASEPWDFGELMLN